MINGKPRYVAVDDWVPGYKSYGVIYSSYSHVQTDGDTWPLILEKAYAKIHGNYKIIEGGLVRFYFYHKITSFLANFCLVIYDSSSIFLQ